MPAVRHILLNKEIMKNRLMYYVLAVITCVVIMIASAFLMTLLHIKGFFNIVALGVMFTIMVYAWKAVMKLAPKTDNDANDRVADK